MLFSEIYGSYYRVVSSALCEAVDHTLTARRLEEIIREKAFAESILSIPASLRNGDWPLLTEDFKTPLCHKPTMPLTTLQKQWLKSILMDPRIQLFGISEEGLEGVPPLYTQDTFIYFDRYTDRDPYEDERYQECFQCILTGLRENRTLQIQFLDQSETTHSCVCIPTRLEYSSKEDKFRFIAFIKKQKMEIPVARIHHCMLMEPYQEHPWQALKTETLVLELVNERKTLERALLHFSHLEKETVRLGETRYRIILHYDKDDEVELLNRVMAFGPMIQILSPDSFLCLVRERLSNQKRFAN